MSQADRDVFDQAVRQRGWSLEPQSQAKANEAAVEALAEIEAEVSVPGWDR
jgi:hypothetical protein